jgi:hypothetical protein
MIIAKVSQGFPSLLLQFPIKEIYKKQVDLIARALHHRTSRQKRFTGN